MKNYHSEDETEFRDFAYAKVEYQKWAPIFIRLGLKPRRYFKDAEAVYMDTAEGWYRLSLVKYEKQDLKWLRSVLEYLDERAFKNWAVPWQRSIIWEESTFCYLIQPWIMGGETLQIGDPASITRVVEVLADFHYCGKDYCETKGLTISRDTWSKIEVNWEESAKSLEQLKDEAFHEKIRPEINDLKKEALTILNEITANWRGSGINTLMEHHRQTGVLGHGNLLTRHITWSKNDFYLLNWEHLAFQPRVKDLASLINDIDIWEPEWILYFIHEYSKLQPFWPEEYHALWGLLRYPHKVLDGIEKAKTEESSRKNLKEVLKSLMRKERCLSKVWRELGTEKRWNWNQKVNDSETPSGKVSMVLSPVEVWGNYTTPIDSLIQISNEHKLPPDIFERLTRVNTGDESNRVVSGRDGSVLDGSAGTGSGRALNFKEAQEYAAQSVTGDNIDTAWAAGVPDYAAYTGINALNQAMDHTGANAGAQAMIPSAVHDGANAGVHTGTVINPPYAGISNQVAANAVSSQAALSDHVNDSAQVASEEAAFPEATVPDDASSSENSAPETESKAAEKEIPVELKEKIPQPSREAMRWSSFPKSKRSV